MITPTEAVRFVAAGVRVLPAQELAGMEESAFQVMVAAGIRPADARDAAAELAAATNRLAAQLAAAQPAALRVEKAKSRVSELLQKSERN